jgi:hypothetical protein
MQYIEHMYLNHPSAGRVPPGATGRTGEEQTMLNEGIIKPDARQLMKTEMIQELHELGGTTPLRWQHAVFKRCTGEDWSEVDWSYEDNKAGAFLWTKSFDQLVEELVDEGFVCQAQDEKSGEAILVPVDVDPDIDWSRFVYPTE